MKTSPKKTTPKKKKKKSPFLHLTKRHLFLGMGILLFACAVWLFSFVSSLLGKQEILVQNIAFEDIFTQKTNVLITDKIHAEKEEDLFLYRLDDMRITSAGLMSSFQIELAHKRNERVYDIWILKYELKEKQSDLLLYRQDKNLKIKDTNADFSTIPPLSSLKAFALFPGKYFGETRPVSYQDYFRFTQHEPIATVNYDFGSQVQEGISLLWISNTGGGSRIAPLFHPNGDYLTLDCIPMIASPNEKNKKALDYNGKIEFMVMVEFK